MSYTDPREFHCVPMNVAAVMLKLEDDALAGSLEAAKELREWKRALGEPLDWNELDPAERQQALFVVLKYEEEVREWLAQLDDSSRPRTTVVRELLS